MFTIDKRDRDLVMILVCLMAAFMLLAWIASPVYATQPVCTGDRHYDEIGECCPLPTECPVCEDCKPVACPDPAPCPSVECKCEAEACTPTTVNVSCPETKCDTFTPCNCRDEYKYKDDVWVPSLQQWCHCAKRSTPARRFLNDAIIP